MQWSRTKWIQIPPRRKLFCEYVRAFMSPCARVSFRSTRSWEWLRENAHTFLLIFFFFSFFFFFCHCSPLWTTASSTTVLHRSLSCYLCLQFLKAFFFESSPTDSGLLNLGFPTCPFSPGLRRVSFLQGSISCLLKRCPSHLKIPIFFHHNYVQFILAHYCILFSLHHYR